MARGAYYNEMSWSDASDRALARLFKRGQPAPTAEQIRDAYPFGERRYWPYKVWLKRVRAWKNAHAMGISAAKPALIREMRQSDTETLDVFASDGS